MYFFFFFFFLQICTFVGEMFAQMWLFAHLWAKCLHKCGRLHICGFLHISRRHRGTKKFARISHPCPKSRICLGQCIFASHGGGGGGGVRRAALLEWLSMGHHRGGGGGIPLPRWGLFRSLGTRNQVLGCVINIKSTSNLARNVYDCSTRGGVCGGGGPFMLLSNVLDTYGESVGGGTPPPPSSHGGDILELRY